MFRFPPVTYPTFYWTTDTIDVLLRFFIIVELVRHLFPKGSLFKVVFSRGLSLAVGGLLLFAISTLWSYQAYASSHSMWTAMERSSSFTQATMTLGLLAAAHYYGIPIAQHLRAIALTFCSWSSITTANNAMMDLGHSFFH